MNDNLLIGVVLLVAAVVGYGVVRLMRLSLLGIIIGVFGAIIGLLIGALLSVPLGKLPYPYGVVLPIAVSLVLALAAIGLFLGQRSAIERMIKSARALVPGARMAAPLPAHAPGQDRILVDTSVIIDGRIADIAAAGFMRATLLVPRFVLAELQNIADSDDAMRRGRGRRGLEMLNSIRRDSGTEVEIIEADFPDIKEVDAKLVALARQLGADVLTTDFNLNRVAQIEGVRVLNINELANAIRPVVLPGEEMVVKIVQAGKEKNQGVGYLPDGTMIVVENGDKLMGQEVATEVTRVFQTVAGKMIFATPKNKIQASQPKNGDRPPKPDIKGGRQRGGRGKPQSIEDRLIEYTNQPGDSSPE